MIEKRGEVFVGYMKCDCESEAVQVTAWPPTRHPRETAPSPGTVDLTFWSMGHWGRCKDWFFRLRRAIHVLRYGHDYTDMVQLSPDRAHRLAGMLRIASERAEGCNGTTASTSSNQTIEIRL